MKTDDLEFHVLACLASAPDGRHGYAVHRWLKEHLKMDVPLPSIYRAAQRLHKKGVVDLHVRGFNESLAGLPRKTFKLTAPGRKYLTTRTAAVRAQAERLQTSLNLLLKAISHGRQDAEGG